jgi:2-hydroxy-3-keto-5-methylthiopentenyl-1-phosphate phosphatase
MMQLESSHSVTNLPKHGKKRNIAIVWDFDKTITPVDSTSKVIGHFSGVEDEFWKYVKDLGGTKDPQQHWERIQASDAPTWTYALSRIASVKGVPLNSKFFKTIKNNVKLYPGVPSFFKKIKALEKTKEFKKVDLGISHFIVSAGLKEYIEAIIPKDMVSLVWGCRYRVTKQGNEFGELPESIPIYCMDETSKTRALFEISKGAFQSDTIEANSRVESSKLWAPFDNIIYIGDGPTDIPALSLTRDRGGVGIVVYNPKMSLKDRKKRLNLMRADRRADLITAAVFTPQSELYRYIETRCDQIRQRYEAETI